VAAWPGVGEPAVGTVGAVEQAPKATAAATIKLSAAQVLRDGMDVTFLGLVGLL